MTPEAAAALFMARLHPHLSGSEIVAAHDDGWVLNHVGFPSPATLSKVKHGSDQAVRQHIARKALQGSRFHLRVLAILHIRNESWRYLCERDYPKIFRLFSETS